MTSGTTQLESGTPLKAGLSPAAAHLRASPPAAGPHCPLHIDMCSQLLRLLIQHGVTLAPAAAWGDHICIKDPCLNCSGPFAWKHSHLDLPVSGNGSMGCRSKFDVVCSYKFLWTFNDIALNLASVHFLWMLQCPSPITPAHWLGPGKGRSKRRRRREIN